MYAFLISFMTGPEILQGKFLPQSFSLDNYIKVFDRLPLLNYLLNSFIVSMGVMLGQLVGCSLAAYAFVFIPVQRTRFHLFPVHLDDDDSVGSNDDSKFLYNPKTRLAEYVSRADVTIFRTGIWNVSCCDNISKRFRKNCMKPLRSQG